MIRFDKTIATTLEILKTYPILVARMREINLVRDLAGAVTVVLPDHLLDDPAREGLAVCLHEALGGYSPGVSNSPLEHSELIDPEDILDSPYRVQIPAEQPFLIDRLLTNQEWLREPITAALPFPTATAFSIKGGVGRSTALAVLAWGLARQGKRVLVVDLDLEAPGISSLLLETLPKYGLLDWMVESLAQQADAALLDDMTGISPLSQECDGSIQVIPAYGEETRDYIAKLGRVYLPTMTKQGEFHGLAHRLKKLLDTIAETSTPPEVVLLDARAGLHDIGAALLAQLPTEIFLFARDDRQTWEAYGHLFRHLQQSRCVEFGMRDTDLRWRLKMVAAQLGVAQNDFNHALSQSYQAWTDFYDEQEFVSYDEQESVSYNEQKSVSYQESDDFAPHYPIPIYFQSPIARKSLIDLQQRPAWEVMEIAFGGFIKAATERLFPSQEDVNGND